MSIATLLESRTYDRRLEYCREHVLPGIVQNALDASNGLSLFMGKMSVAMFGQAAMSSKGKRTSSGESIVGKVRLGANTSMQRLAGGEYATFDTSASDTVRHWRANWTYYGGTVNISYNEILQNRGLNFADIVQSEMEDGVASLVDSVEFDLFSNGGSNAIENLASIINNNDAIHGLSGATYAPWNSRGISARGTAASAISFTGGSFATTGLQNWRVAYENGSEGNTTPQALLTTHDIKTFYEASLQPQERFNTSKMADGGFQTLQFKTASVVPAPRCVSGDTYFLNFDHLFFNVLEGADFDSGPFIEPEAQNVRIAKVFSTLQLVCSARKLQNKVILQTA